MSAITAQCWYYFPFKICLKTQNNFWSMLATWRMIENAAIFDDTDEENSEDDAP